MKLKGVFWKEGINGLGVGPQWMRRLVPYKRKFDLPACAHDRAYDVGGSEADRLRADLAGEDARRITLDDTFRSDNAKDAERLQVLLYNHDVDAVIAGEEVIRTLAAYGYFQDITGVLAEDAAKAAENEGRLFRTAGYLDTEEISMEDHETGRGEVLPYGLRLAGSSRWKSLTGDTAPDYLAAVMCESEHMKEVSALVSLLA